MVSMKQKLTIADIALLVLCACSFSVKAQNKVDLLDYSACQVIFFHYDYAPVAYDEYGRATNYGWVMSENADGTRHKVITPTNSTGTDPNVPVSDLPANANKSVRLGTMSYITNFYIDEYGNCQLNSETSELAKGGGVIYKYQVTEENAIMYVNYAMMLTDSKPDHINTLTNLIGQYAWNDGIQDYWIGDASLYQYEGDWTYQQPWIHFYLAVDGQILECADHQQVLYDTQGNPIPLDSQTWGGKQFQITDDSGGQCSITYSYDAYYKNWTLMAIDLTPYIGHTVAFAAEYYDCAQAGWYYLMDENYNVYYNEPQIYTCDDHHMSRLYLNVSCSPNGDGVTQPFALTLENEDCLNNQVTYSAPEGFYSYKWYSSTNPGLVLSNSPTCTYTFGPEDRDLTLYCTVTSSMTIGCANEETTFSVPVQNKCPVEGEFVLPTYVCADAATLDIAFNYTSGYPKSYDIVFDDNAVANGFVNLTNQPIPAGSNAIHVPMPQSIAGPSLTAHYVRPGIYYYYIVIHQSNGTDKTYEARPLEVRFPSWLISQRWDDVLAILNQNYNGGYIFSGIQWYQDGAPAYSAASYPSYIYQPGGLNPASEYWAVLTRTLDGVSLCTCPVRPVIQQYAPEKSPERIQLTADNADRRIVRVNTDLSGTYTLYNIDGKVLNHGCFGEEYGSPVIQLPAAGAYIIRFRDNEQGEETKKWIAE